MSDPSPPASGPAAADPAQVALARARALSRQRAASAAAKRSRPADPIMTAPGPDARDPQTLADSIVAWVREHQYDADLAVAGLVGRWTEIVGEQLARHVTVGEYRAEERRVVLLADSQEWALQVRYLLSQVRRRIDEELGSGVIDDIEVRGPGGRGRSGGWRVRTGRRSPRGEE